jgi:hypothetical protein
MNKKKRRGLFALLAELAGSSCQLSEGKRFMEKPRGVGNHATSCRKVAVLASSAHLIIAEPMNYGL